MFAFFLLRMSILVVSIYNVFVMVVLDPTHYIEDLYLLYHCLLSSF